MSEWRECIITLPIFRRDDIPQNHTYLMPIGNYSLGPGIYVHSGDERTDEQIREAYFNLDWANASY